MRLKNIIWKTVVMSLMASPLCISCDDDEFAGFLVAAGTSLHACFYKGQQVFFSNGCQFLEVAAGASFENFIHVHSSLYKRVRQKRGISPDAVRIISFPPVIICIHYSIDGGRYGGIKSGGNKKDPPWSGVFAC